MKVRYNIDLLPLNKHYENSKFSFSKYETFDVVEPIKLKFCLKISGKITI